MKTKQWDINLHTPLVPYIIAERTIWKVLSEYKPELTHPECVDIVTAITPELTSRAEWLYKRNGHFRKSINNKTADCRYTLEMFMEHWTKAILKIKAS